MSACTKASSVIRSSSQLNIQKLCIFAGSGELPKLLVDYCLKNKIEPYVVGFKGQTNSSLYKEHSYLETHIGKSGKTLNWIKENNVQAAVFIGAIRRPLLRTMIPDWTTLKFFLTRGIWARGDNAILSAAREFLEEKGNKAVWSSCFPARVINAERFAYKI